MLRLIWRFLRTRERISLLFVFIIILSGAALDLLSVSLIVPLVSSVLGNAKTSGDSFSNFNFDQQSTEILVFVLLGIFLMKNVLVVISAYLQARIINKINASFVQVSFVGLLHRPYAFHLQTSSTTLTRNLQDGAYSIVNGVINPMLAISSDVLVAAVLLSFTFILYPEVSIIIMLSLGLAGFLLAVTTRRRLERLGEERNRYRGELLKVMAESFRGIREVLVLGRQETFAQVHQHSLQALSSSNVKFQVIQTLPRTVIEMIGITVLMAGIGLLATQGKPPTEVFGLAATLSFVAFRVMPTVQRLSLSVQAMSFNLPLVRAALADIEWARANTTDGTSEVKSDALSSSDFKEITFIVDGFTYEESEKMILGKTALSVRRGSFTVILGETGSGKSSFLALIAGLLDSSRFQVLVDGVRSDVSGPSWRSRIGYVPQDVYLLDDTIRSNIHFDPQAADASDDLVWAALERACIADYVRSLPLQLDSRVGEDGVRLSGGQRQRLGIARAFFRQPILLLLDESTSALDVDTEQEVLKDLARMREEVTIIMVTHRPAAVHVASSVFRLSLGVLTESPSESRSKGILTEVSGPQDQ